MGNIEYLTLREFSGIGEIVGECNPGGILIYCDRLAEWMGNVP